MTRSHDDAAPTSFIDRPVLRRDLVLQIVTGMTFALFVIFV